MNRSFVLSIRINGLLMLFLLALVCHGQTSKFLNPIAGELTKDYLLVNYVDWEFNGILDHACGSKTYDGHQGSDYVLRSFAQMDSGVQVLSVDSGVVIAVKDGLFDRETGGDVSKGLGNYVGIKHAGKLFTYYAHLKKNSIQVQVGDSVFPGYILGHVGSSGNSTDPHLHFELWYDSSILIDPFAGACGNPNSYWLDAPPYDTNTFVWESGLLDFSPTLDQLRERPQQKRAFILDQDSIISYWNLQTGIRNGDTSKITWYTPSENLWFEWKYGYSRDWWYHYYWSYIPVTSSMEEGEWRVVYAVNDIVQDSSTFHISSGVFLDPQSDDQARIYYANGILHFRDNKTISELHVSNSQGKTVVHKENLNTHFNSFSISKLTPGVYYAKVLFKDGSLETLHFVRE